MTAKRRAYLVLFGLTLAAVSLLVVGLAGGGVGRGELDLAEPCSPRAALPREGLDATLQQIVLDGLDGAACELGTSRERLVLSLDPSPRRATVPWTRPTAERALRAGMLRAVDEAERRDRLEDHEAGVLREVIRRAPIDALIRGIDVLADYLRDGGVEGILDLLPND